MPSRLSADTALPASATAIPASVVGGRESATTGMIAMLSGLCNDVTFFVSNGLADGSLVPDPQPHETRALVVAEKPMAALSQ